MIIPFESRNTGYMDLTGRFSYRSSSGNEYIMVVYDYDSNAILTQPLKNRQAASIRDGFNKLVTKLADRGEKPKLFVLDNEISEEFRTALKKHNLEHQLVPPHQHRRNAAERAIQTFKNHFIAGLASTNPKFPIREWDRLLNQAEITLNLLRNSRLNPKLSAYAFLFGNFDFNKTPMAPPGTQVVVHEKSTQRATWDPQGVDGWYTGPAMEHYRCVKAYIPSTSQERICDTIEFFPHSIPLPTTSDAHYLKQAADDILAVLNKPKPTLPYSRTGDEMKDAIEQTAKLLNRSIKRSTPPTPPEIQITPPSKNQQHSVASKPTSMENSSNNPIQFPRVVEIDENEASHPRVQNKLSDRPHIIQHVSSPYIPPQLATNFKKLRFEAFVANIIFQPTINHIYNEKTGKRETPDSLLNGPNKIIWNKATSNEFGLLAQGNKYGVSATDTIEFIVFKMVPPDRDVTYLTMVFDYRPLKSESYRCRIVVEGDKLSYYEDASAPTTDLTETKLLLNSVISDAWKGARFCSADLKDFFLASPMERPEYAKVHIKYIPQDIIDQYNLMELVHNNYVYIKIKRGMYGLKQAALLAYHHLLTFLKPAGYIPIANSIGMWKHRTRKTIFCLCIDDFGIKYMNDEDLTHLLTILRANYGVTVDKEGRNFCGLNLDWNYQQGYVDVSMPGYIQKVLLKYHHPKPKRPKFSPHKHVEPIYGAKPRNSNKKQKNELSALKNHNFDFDFNK